MAALTSKFNKAWFAGLFILLVAGVGLIDFVSMTTSGTTRDEVILRSPEPRRRLSESSFRSGEMARNLEYSIEAPSLTVRTLRPRWNEAMFRMTGRVTPKVIVGRERWLFQSVTLREPLIGKDFDHSISAILSVQERVRRSGAELIVLVVPNKYRFYRDYLPAHARVAPEPEAAYRRFVSMLGGAGIHTVDLETEFEEAQRRAPSEPLYRAHDNHWTSFGIETAAKAIARRVEEQRLLPRAPERAAYRALFERTTRRTEFFGALARMLELPPDSTLTESLTDHVTIDDYRLRPGAREFDPGVRVRLFGTSFADDSNKLLARHLAFQLGCPVDSEQVHSGGGVGVINAYEPAAAGRAQLVVWELPETYTPGAFFAAVDLNSKPPTPVSYEVEHRIENERMEKGRMTFDVRSHGIPHDGTRALRFEMRSIDAPGPIRGRVWFDTGGGFGEPEFLQFLHDREPGWREYTIPLRDMLPKGPRLRSVRLEPVYDSEPADVELRDISIVKRVDP